MAGNSRDFLIRILGDSENAKKAVDGFNKKLDDSTSKLDGFFASFTGNLAADLFQDAAAAAGDFISGSIDQASDLNETLSAAEAIFGDQTAAMDKWSQNAAQNLGLSQGAALDAATGFGDMFQQLGFAGDQASGMSQDVLQMAADLGSFRNLDTSDVLDKISGAMRGEYDSLQALIPNINAARVEQEALAATGKESAKELTAQEKAAATLAIINKDGAAAMGDFAKTSDSAANQQKIMTATLEEQQAELGEQLLPAWTELQGFLIDSVLPAFTSVIGWLADNQWVYGVVAGGVLAIAAAYTIWQFATGAWTVAQIAANVAMLASPITWIILGIVALVAAIIWLVANWDTVVAWITEIWGGFMTWIGEVIDGFVAWWDDTWAGISEAWSDFWDGVAQVVKDIWNGIIGWIESGINGAIDLINGMIDGVNLVGGAFGVNIEHIGHVSLPKLATGGVTSGPMVAMIGDNPGGREVVQPLSSLRSDRQADIRAAVRAAVLELRGGGGGETVSVTQQITALPGMSEEQVADAAAQRLGAVLRSS
ncbi:hypothetical protein [Microbacterium sp.]|uniref:hypothetical protein n=1 Tax=Microbacterium sp. TaxID=51671 RepID=UPI002812547D|nr:hypothetical protein [Microbacterium sp.]